MTRSELTYYQDFESLGPGVTRRTLQRELKGLVDKGLLVPEGSTTRLYYRFEAPGA